MYFLKGSSGKFLGRADAFLERVHTKFGLALDGSDEYFKGLAEENDERFNAEKVADVTVFAADARSKGTMGDAVALLRTVIGDVDVALLES